MIIKRIKEVFQKHAPPNFIIIGAQKSGTSSLFSYLAQHPQLLPSSNKEVHYFDSGLNPEEDNFQKGESWYRKHFPLKKEMSRTQKTFEASPLYIFNPLVPKRIHRLIPNVKIIAVLRNPTERAISQYFHEWRLNMEPLPLMQAVQAEEQRVADAIATKNYKSSSYIHFTYKSRGLYHTQLERYFNYFSRKQILVLNSDDLFNKTEETLERVFDFIGVDSGFKTADLKPRNISANRVVVEPVVYEYLNDYFLAHNQSLYDLLGENFNW